MTVSAGRADMLSYNGEEKKKRIAVLRSVKPQSKFFKNTSCEYTCTKFLEGGFI